MSRVRMMAVAAFVASAAAVPSTFGEDSRTLAKTDNVLASTAVRTAKVAAAAIKCVPASKKNRCDKYQSDKYQKKALTMKKTDKLQDGIARQCGRCSEESINNVKWAETSPDDRKDPAVKALREQFLDPPSPSPPSVPTETSGTSEAGKGETGKGETGKGETGPPSKSSGSSGCFAKDSSTACLLASPAAACERVLMADLVPGDLVLGRDGATTVVAVQHKAFDTLAEMLTFHTAGGATVSMTPDHAVFVDGALVAAADVRVGSALSTGTVTKITKGEGAIINAVTASGTIVADGVVAASNPMWIAALIVDAPLTRAAVNAVLFAVGDVDSVAAGCANVAATLATAALAAKALTAAHRKVSA